MPQIIGGAQPTCDDRHQDGTIEIPAKIHHWINNNFKILPFYRKTFGQNYCGFFAYLVCLNMVKVCTGYSGTFFKGSSRCSNEIMDF